MAKISTRDAALALDAADALGPLRDEFALPEGVIYLDGNSLGALPRRTAARVQQTIEAEWGQGLIRSWNDAGWITLAHGIGDAIAELVGAGPGEVSVGDSTSVNLFKVLSAAAALQKSHAPGRTTIVSERSNFPTDLYIAESVAASAGLKLRLIDAENLPDDLNKDVAVLMLTHVNYRSGRMHDMAGTTRIAHAAGALVVWDLAHSAGDEGLRQPLCGWLGHAAPFDFTPSYRPAAGIGRFVCGTPPILAMRALQCGLEVFSEAKGKGGMTALRAKSTALTDLFIERVEQRCLGHGLELATPRERAERGSQVSFAHSDGYAIMQALIARGVIGDFRAGHAESGEANLLRFGFTPLYTRFVDAWDAAEAIADVLASAIWREPRFGRRAAVT
jgi:kynureninase